MTREFARYQYHNAPLEYNEERDWWPNAVQKEEIWKRVCEAWYNVTPNVLE